MACMENGEIGFVLKAAEKQQNTETDHAIDLLDFTKIATMTVLRAVMNNSVMLVTVAQVSCIYIVAYKVYTINMT